MKLIPKDFRIIALTGQMYSGKSTISQWLIEYFNSKDKTAIIIPFAKKIKDFAYMLGWNGQKDEKGRKLLQLIGTEVGRNCISENIWINFWLQDCNRFASQYNVIIVDDLRFNNEAEILKIHNATIIKTLKEDDNNISETLKHESEGGIKDEYVDYLLKSPTGLSYLRKEFDIMITELKL